MKREHQAEEWKASWRDEYLKWVCGFASTEGGPLVIGRNAKAAPNQISMYAKKLMLLNAGELPDRWTLATLGAKHASIPFNPDIANTFFSAGHIEAWGRGIERIMDACREANTPRPKCATNPLGSGWSFRFPPVRR